MKYFVISDVHGFYDEMINALNEAGFDRDNPGHCLVSCGDNFDRGSKPVEVMNYLLSLERKVLVRGNHESLFNAIMMRNRFEMHDLLNGTRETAQTFMDRFNVMDAQQLYPFMKPYFSSLTDYFETENHIFVHAWIPTDEGSFRENWREASARDWERASWQNPFECRMKGLNRTGKTIVFGHWHNSWMRAVQDQLSKGAHYTDAKYCAGENSGDFPCGIYNGEGFIGLDACTVLTKQVNVAVIED